MIGQQTVTGYLTQLAILGQPFLWMWLYDSQIKFPDVLKYYFYLIGFEFIIFVMTMGINIGFYTTNLLVQYALLTMFATFFYNQRNPIKEAISLAFLTVFLNSFYWEIPLHLAELFSGPPHMGMLVQLWRLVPAFWFRKNYTFSDGAHWTLALGLLLSLLLTGVTYFRILSGLIMYPIVRLGCLLCLMKTIIEAKPISKGGKGNKTCNLIPS